MPQPPPQTTSNAIEIVKPSSSSSNVIFTNNRRIGDTPQPRQCRNVLIYGSCKYEGKGCSFQHPPRPDSSLEGPTEPVRMEPSRVASPISLQHLNAPEFVPSSIPYTTPSEATISSPTSITAIQIQIQNKDSHAFDAGSSGKSGQSAVPFPDIAGTQHGFFVSNDINYELQQRMHDIWAPPVHVSSPVPEEIHNYHSIVPLEALTLDRRKYFGHWYSSCYRATNTRSGQVYTLRRLENFRLTHESALASIEPWRQFYHPNIVSIREAFTTRAFNDSSLVLVYDYHPLSATLYDKYLKSRTPSGPSHRIAKIEPIDIIPEPVIWSFIIQIANAMKATHDRGLAFRVLDSTKVLLTGHSRIRINCCGMADLIGPEIADISTYHQEDIISFGRLMISLCCRTANPGSNYPKALDFIGRTYSLELKNALQFLVTPQLHPTHGSPKIIGQIFDFIGGRLLDEMDSIQLRSDSLESQLACELENGRLVRLLSKFGFINERPEFAHDFRWSETGDKYIVKLFRDFVFHSVDPNGHPVISLTHVLTHLNKLDSGSEEKLMLVSRDEQSCLVVSYKEVKRCVEAAFRELAIGPSAGTVF
ncbi:PAB-dependent poly(A)-specific ribonuclease subunit 3 [Serendipita sp. 400]|nr:PAB-dependent poly(A)-specific ribonuclease subunit 3 [Serendipita sp. 400]